MNLWNNYVILFIICKNTLPCLLLYASKKFHQGSECIISSIIMLLEVPHKHRMRRPSFVSCYCWYILDFVIIIYSVLWEFIFINFSKNFLIGHSSSNNNVIVKVYELFKRKFSTARNNIVYLHNII